VGRVDIGTGIDLQNSSSDLLITTTSGHVRLTEYLRQEGIFGGIHMHDASAGAQSINNGATYVKVTGFTDNSLAMNTTPDVANDKITLTVPGTYKVEWNCSFASGTNGINFFGAVYSAGVEQDQIHWERKIGTANDVGSASASDYITITGTTDIDCRVRHDGGAAVNFTMNYSQFTATYVGDTNG
jgi:hypothetical protein